MPVNGDHNYYSTFISVADDCPAAAAQEPPTRAAGPTAAQIHLQMARDEPYAYTQEQILFRTHLNAKGSDPAEEPEGGSRWQAFFAKGQPCLRTLCAGETLRLGLPLRRARTCQGRPGRVRRVPAPLGRPRSATAKGDEVDAPLKACAAHHGAYRYGPATGTRR